MTIWECWVEGEYGTLQEVAVRFNNGYSSAAVQFAEMYLKHLDKYVEMLSFSVVVRNKYEHSESYIVNIVWHFEPKAVVNGAFKC